jgi:hypothetical protein
MGARIFDMNCGWTMYREPYNGSFRYKCGLYQQSHGQKCAHNHVDGSLATKFTLTCIRQKLVMLLPRVEQRLRELAAENAVRPKVQLTAETIAAELTRVREELPIVSGNLARARTDEQYQAVSLEFDQLKTRETSLPECLAEAKVEVPTFDCKVDVASIVTGLDRLLTLTNESEELKLAGAAIRQANAKLPGFRAVDDGHKVARGG